MRFLSLFALVLTLSAQSSAAEDRAITLTGADHFRPFAAYAKIKNVMGQAVSRGRVEFFEAKMVGFEGTTNFCLQFDDTASSSDIDAVKAELLGISGVGEVQRTAGIALLGTAPNCPRGQ